MIQHGIGLIGGVLINRSTFCEYPSVRFYCVTLYIHVLTLYALSTTIIAFNSFPYPIKSLLLEIKLVFNHQDLQIFVLKLNKCE